jgi:hypothetical protein
MRYDQRFAQYLRGSNPSGQNGEQAGHPKSLRTFSKSGLAGALALP